MNTLEAAYHEGKSHGLSKHSYACRYDEGTEEHRRYHDGYKEGLDECYGLMPNQGLVDESGVAEGSEGISIEDMVMDQYHNGNEVWEIASNMGMGEDEVHDIINDGGQGMEEGNAFKVSG